MQKVSNVCKVYPIKPVICSINSSLIKGNGIDERKAYTKKAMNME